MNRKKWMIMIAAAVLLVGGIVCTILLTQSGREDAAPTQATTEPSQSEEPTVPSQPEQPSAQRYLVELSVTDKDGKPAKGAAIVATHSSGFQEYEATDDMGLAALSLPEGKHTVQIFCDGQRSELELEVAGEDLQLAAALKEQRTLYILLTATGGYEGEPNQLESFPMLEAALREKYPNAVYLTAENRYDVTFRDGDALLTAEVFVENYTSNQQYFASELRFSFKTYQQTLAAWSKDGGGEEIEQEYLDGNLCAIRLRCEYDYGYSETLCTVTESYYAVQKELHLNKHTPWADAWGYGYETENLLSNSAEQRTKAQGAGLELESFFSKVNETRYQDALTYAQQLYPYIDLWLSGGWNEGIAQLTAQ